MSMVSDSKSFSGYLHQIIPGIKDCLVDTIPDVRAGSAKALGSIVSGINIDGEENEEITQLMDW